MWNRTVTFVTIFFFVLFTLQEIYSCDTEVDEYIDQRIEIKLSDFLPQNLLNTLNTDDVVTAATRIVKEFVIPEFERKLAENSVKIKQEVKEEMREEFAEREEKLRQELLQTATENEDDSNHLEELDKLHAEKNCEELSYHGIEQSGTYYIDSDGIKTGEKPFKAFCQFEGDEVSTQIPHDVSPNHDLNHCNDGPGCALIKFNYETSAEQLKAMIQNSETCYQDIKMDCTMAPLQLYGQQLGWFHNLNQEQRNLSTYICTDGVCNCDSNELNSDSGRITDPELLPVSSIAYGPIEFEDRQMKVTVGPLICMGSKDSILEESDVQELKDKFKAFEEDSERTNGLIQTIQSSVQQNRNDIEFAKQKVIFSAVRKSGHVSVGSVITYDETVANVGEGMNPDTGRFKAPLSGIYSFSFSTLTANSHSSIHVYVMKNNAKQFNIHQNLQSLKSYDNLSYSWTMVLNQNDEVHLKVSSGKGLYVSPNYYHVWFNGQLEHQQ